jgi:DNA mismatch endonuclease (patch repair protein)
MARVKRSETAPELALRSALWQRGLRYRLRPRLPGTPDLAFVGTRVAVFVDGCFWHGCPDHYTAPRTNADFWLVKIETNRARDLRVDAELRALGWRAVRIWEHVIVTDIDEAIRRVVDQLEGRS